MNIKSGIGAKNPIDMPYLSAIKPIIDGNKAPPTIDITINEAAFLVLSPKSLIPKAKMVGNMIDIQKKITYNAIRETQPKFMLTTGNKAMAIIE